MVEPVEGRYEWEVTEGESQRDCEALFASWVMRSVVCPAMCVCRVIGMRVPDLGPELPTAVS